MMRLIGIGIIVAALNVGLFAQCETWIGNAKQSQAEDAHSVYRQALKTDDYAIAFEYWEKAYNIAPAADGARDYHMTDGVKIYLNKLSTATDDAAKAEYKEKVVDFYNQAIDCYSSGGINYKCKSADQSTCNKERIAYLKGRMGYDMYYYLNSPYSENYKVLDEAIKEGGNGSEYIVLDPFAKITVYQFQNNVIDKATALANFETMEAIANYNIENNADYGEYYEQAWAAAKGHYVPVENEIFDCEFFKAKYRPEYDANPDDTETIKTLIVYLKKRGCDESDPFLSELETKWEKYAATTNAARQAEFEANNPAMLAKKAYDAGDFEEAVRKYDDAINTETDQVKKARMLFSKASIQFRKLQKYNDARATARESGKLDPSSGKPYMLIGDMYATGARNCGDSWNQRLAIIAAIEKYNYAASIDPAIADEAKGKASKYRSSLPEKQEGFMRGVKSGDSQTVGCWIGESVKVRFQ